ncbi:ATP-binding protein [Yinghuangia sp. ASG 101]|uniref:ATP-binding protein n=1 Tax=Yinghuangia sp. ASG 101 TaxID=2896848 RepID=UPI001E521C76|nr:ATP-binding protein [Yinghuangia sp. ASG 101]UGQ10496.1 ATP-binding protein [Yinghuangia sp. ASG 101]
MTEPLDEPVLAPGPGAHAPHAVCFTQSRAAVVLHTDWPTAYAHARDTLYSYGRSPYGPAPRHVRLAQSPDLDPEMLQAVFDGSPVQEIGPSLIARVLLLPETGRAYWIPAHNTLIHASTDGARAVASCRDEHAALYWGFRLVRQAMTAQLLAAGAVYAHCAAFNHNGRGVMIAGHRGWGKTTTLLAALRHLGGDYVTNDRLLLHVHGGVLTGHPWPTDLRVGAETLRTLPHLRRLIPDSARDLPSDERQRLHPKIVVQPAQFGQLAPGGIVDDTARPELMIWPRLEPGRPDTVVERVAPTTVAQVLRDTRMFMTDPSGGPSTHINHWLWPTPPDAVTRHDIAVIADYAADLPCYRIRTGGDPKQLAHRIAELLGVAPPDHRARR